jgi:hypothetical protein
MSVLDSGIMELDEEAHSNTSGIDKELVKTFKLRRNILKQLVESRAKVVQEERMVTEGVLSTQVSTVDGSSAPPSLNFEHQVSERAELFGMSSGEVLPAMCVLDVYAPTIV